MLFLSYCLSKPTNFEGRYLASACYTLASALLQPLRHHACHIAHCVVGWGHLDGLQCLADMYLSKLIHILQKYTIICLMMTNIMASGQLP